MYMAPIARTKAPASITARRLTGAVVLPVSAALMLPFLALFAIYAAGALALRGAPAALRGLRGAPRALLDMVDYAGAVVLGR